MNIIKLQVYPHGWIAGFANHNNNHIRWKSTNPNATPVNCKTSSTNKEKCRCFLTCEPSKNKVYRAQTKHRFQVLRDLVAATQLRIAWNTIQHNYSCYLSLKCLAWLSAKTNPNAAPALNACPVADHKKSDASSASLVWSKFLILKHDSIFVQPRNIKNLRGLFSAHLRWRFCWFCHWSEPPMQRGSVRLK